MERVKGGSDISEKDFRTLVVVRRFIMIKE
jgi:hypothetical protein